MLPKAPRVGYRFIGVVWGMVSLIAHACHPPGGMGGSPSPEASFPYSDRAQHKVLHLIARQSAPSPKLQSLDTYVCTIPPPTNQQIVPFLRRRFAHGV